MPSALLPLVLAFAAAAFASSSATANAAPRHHASERPAPVRAASKMAGAANARGLYVRGVTAARPDYERLLQRAAAHGLDTVVLDAKDYDGVLTYPSRVPLAVTSGATKDAPITDFKQTIRKAQALGLRVAVRISCFEDELMAKAHPELSVRSKAGRAYPIGWLDPANPGAQSYAIALVEEALDAGADEIQLDYVRYPVLGIKNADFGLEARGLTKPQVIRDFVRKVHGVTRARGVPLALDVFGVIAFGKREDIERLGQDPVLLAQECEVLSPMVYPSHYAPGFYGFDEPGDHPELVGMAMKAFQAQIDAAGVKNGAVVRPWLQAMAWKSPGFSSGYVARQIQSAADAGGSGFLLWNPGQSYGVSFTALAAQKAHREARAAKVGVGVDARRGHRPRP